MAESRGVRRVGYFDCAGGGVKDPKSPKALAILNMEFGTHSHKVRVGNGLMLVNHEVNRNEPGASIDFRGGLAIYDIETRAGPRSSQNGKPPDKESTATITTVATSTAHRLLRDITATSS
jgi:hypothetical protein